MSNPNNGRHLSAEQKAALRHRLAQGVKPAVAARELGVGRASASRMLSTMLAKLVQASASEPRPQAARREMHDAAFWRKQLKAAEKDLAKVELMSDLADDRPPEANMEVVFDKGFWWAGLDRRLNFSDVTVTFCPQTSAGAIWLASSTRTPASATAASRLRREPNGPTLFDPAMGEAKLFRSRGGEPMPVRALASVGRG